ncbi:unnamed protein product [Ilex paraguariensis]|uniref:GATA-type domain-containing protein n=1 Tax=Ilex paraguariensis TaxID=185542 RepID=A0ABC8TCK2_9AQUA
MKTSMIGSDYFGGFDNGICEDDSIDHMLNFFDMPMESLEGDGEGEDWFEKFQRLGPIPTEVLSGSPLVSQGKDGDGTLDMQPMPSIPKTSMIGSDYFGGFDNGICEDDSIDHMLNFFDMPMESLEGDGEGEDWFEKFQRLGPIPTEVLSGSPLVSQGKDGDGTLDMQPMPSIPNDGTPKLSQQPKFVEETSSTSIPLQNDSSDGKESAVFQSPSPISVLDNSSSCSVEKSKSIRYLPGAPRTKRSRASTFSQWFAMSPILFAASASEKKKRKGRKKKLSQLTGAMERQQNSFLQGKKKLCLTSDAMETNEASLHRPATKKCTHCQVTKTPQWREGPMGPKTLCNACGVRYRSGRLFPEYRPAASPTFVPSLHSNSHRRVIEMRNKGFQEPAMTEADCGMSPPPEFVPMSSYFFDGSE